MEFLFSKLVITYDYCYI